jgi:FtsP/CotA-like multicopper oxidase with cupredoxin domain
MNNISIPSRRKFLQWATVIAYPSVPSMLLNACGAGGDGVGSILSDLTLTPTTPTKQASELNPTSLTITAKPVRAVYVPGKIPTAVNAWSFVNAAKVTATTPLLSNHFGPTIEVRRKAPLSITWANGIPASAVGSSYQANPPYPILPYNGLCGSVAAQSPVGINVHLHGAKVNGNFDGWPLTPVGYANNPYKFPSASTFTYPNNQRATLLWYHDHSLDNTAPNVYAGLAGLYVVRDAYDDNIISLIGGAKQEILMGIHDRKLTSDSLALDYQGGRVMDTSVYQAVRAEFLADTLFINGNPSSFAAQAVDRRVFRLRLLNAANARTLCFGLFDPAALTAGSGRVWYSDAITTIGADQGLSGVAVPLTSTGYITITPGQRRDILIDFSKIPSTVKSLSIANLAIIPRLPQNVTVPPTPEPIFTTYADFVLSPTSQNYTATDATLYTALKTDPIATLTTFTLNTNTVAQITAFKIPTITQINAILMSANNLSDDHDLDFFWNGSALSATPGIKFGPNRLVLPISNIEGFAPTVVGNGLAGWSDVQIFELVDGSITPDADNGVWALPINVDLKTTTNPLPGNVTNGSQVNYTIARRSFLQTRSNPDITVAKKYPALHTPAIVAKANTYERWYVANIPNSQPLTSLHGKPDMHPFHIHIVNMVVTRRWELVNGQFIPVVLEPNNLDLVGRQDTVTIPSNQLVEMLVHYPAGYTGDYVYHCHLIEHEDACMMSSLRVTL